MMGHMASLLACSGPQFLIPSPLLPSGLTQQPGCPCIHRSFEPGSGHALHEKVCLGSGLSKHTARSKVNSMTPPPLVRFFCFILSTLQPRALLSLSGNHGVFLSVLHFSYLSDLLKRKMPLRDYTVTWASLKDSNDMAEAGWGAGYGWSWHNHSLAVVPPVRAGMFAALESFMPGPGA